MGLAQAGVVVQDFTDHAYVEGLAVEIIATEERSELGPDTCQIVETVRPSVYISGSLAAQGQVILGRGLAKREVKTDGTGDD
jgi:hypothetical protein